MAPRRLVLVLVGLLAACSGGIAGPSASPVAGISSPVQASPRPSPRPSPSPSPTPPPLTLSGLFHPGPPFAHDPAHVRTMIATGDVIPARLVDYYATQK